MFKVAFPHTRRHTKFPGKWFHIQQCQTQIVLEFQNYSQNPTTSLQLWSIHGTIQGKTCFAQLRPLLIHWYIDTHTFTNAVNKKQKEETKSHVRKQKKQSLQAKLNHADRVPLPNELSNHLRLSEDVGLHVGTTWLSGANRSHIYVQRWLCPSAQVVPRFVKKLTSFWEKTCAWIV